MDRRQNGSLFYVLLAEGFVHQDDRLGRLAEQGPNQAAGTNALQLTSVAGEYEATAHGLDVFVELMKVCRGGLGNLVDNNDGILGQSNLAPLKATQ